MTVRRVKRDSVGNIVSSRCMLIQQNYSMYELYSTITIIINLERHDNMRIKALTIFLTLTLILAITMPLSQGNSSGRHNSGSSGCSCHGGASSSISATENFPAEYDPSNSGYSITIGFHWRFWFWWWFSLQINKGTLSNAGSNMKISGSSATHSGGSG